MGRYYLLQPTCLAMEDDQVAVDIAEKSVMVASVTDLATNTLLTCFDQVGVGSRSC